MKYSYMKKISWEEKLLYTLIIIVTVFAIYANTISPINQPTQYNTEIYEIFTSNWWKSMIGIFIFDIFTFYCIYLFSSKRRNYKKWRLELEKIGHKCSGEIKEIRFISSNLYRIKVSYYSNLSQENKVFEIPNIYFENLDTNKKIVCDVYETDKMKEQHDYESDIFSIEDNNINININPFKLITTVHKKYTDKNFGNAHAINFRYDVND